MTERRLEPGCSHAFYWTQELPPWSWKRNKDKQIEIGSVDEDAILIFSKAIYILVFFQLQTLITKYMSTKIGYCLMLHVFDYLFIDQRTYQSVRQSLFMIEFRVRVISHHELQMARISSGHEWIPLHHDMPECSCSLLKKDGYYIPYLFF